jgi:hypothetical protein
MLSAQGSYRLPSELWIVMEYCGGGSVNDLLSATGEPLTEDLIAYVCGEALKVGKGWEGEASHCRRGLGITELREQPDAEVDESLPFVGTYQCIYVPNIPESSCSRYRARPRAAAELQRGGGRDQ